MAPASASPKRPHDDRVTSNSDKKRRLSPSPSQDGVREDTLRIVAETLRKENETLQTQKKTLEDRLAASKKTMRQLEDDMERVYKQKQQEVDALTQEKLQLQQAHKEKVVVKRVQVDSETTQEMDAFLESCTQWQSRLSSLSGQLKHKVDAVESQEVDGVVKDLVVRVEIKMLQEDVDAKQELLHWAGWMQGEAEACMKQLNTSRQDTEDFEAMERQLLVDRVVELETQLAQKRTIEREKEMELSSLRADQDELARSTHAVPKEQWEALVSEKKAMAAELETLKEEVKQQGETLARVTAERQNFEQYSQQLVADSRKAREQQETKTLEAAEQSSRQEKVISQLQEQLQSAKTREAQMLAMFKTAEKDAEKNRRRKEELKILYSKFSSSMDNLAEKTMKIEDLELELKDARQQAQAQKEQLESELNEARCKATEAETHKGKLELQIAQLHQDQSDLLTAEHRDSEALKKNLSEAQQRCSVLTQREAQLQAEVDRLESRIQALTDQHVGKEHQSVGQASNEVEKQARDELLVRSVAEKEALQLFIKRYYAAAEDKCSRLLEKVSELEAKSSSTQQQTRESCNLLRMCTQTDSCDDSIRASLLDVVATCLGPDATAFDPNGFKLRLEMAGKSTESSRGVSSRQDFRLDVANCDLVEGLRRKNHQIRSLKSEKRALARDLKRSRRVGCELQSDLARLQQQRRKELTRDRRARRDLSDREKVFASRERESDRLLLSATRIDAVLRSELYNQQTNAVHDVVRRLVDSVEQSANAEADAERQRERLTQLRTQTHELQTWRRRLGDDMRALKAQLTVPFQFLAEGVTRLQTQVDASHQELQLEQQLRCELEAHSTEHQEELAASVAMLQGLVLSNRSLSECLRSSAQQLDEVEAERDEWQNQVHQLQREHEQLRTQQTEQQASLRAELADVGAKHRAAQAANVSLHQQLRIAQLALKAAQREQRSLRDRVTTLEAEALTPLLPNDKGVGRLPTLRSLTRR